MLLFWTGMLKLVLSKGGRDELRIALHCFKDQLQAATNRQVLLASEGECKAS
jgi:hypothetical protein